MHHQIITSEGFARPRVGGDGVVRVGFMRNIPGWTIRARPDHQRGRLDRRGAVRASGRDTARQALDHRPHKEEDPALRPGANPEVAAGHVAKSQPDGVLLCRIADLRCEPGDDTETHMIVNWVDVAAVRAIWLEPRGSVQ